MAELSSTERPVKRHKYTWHKYTEEFDSGKQRHHKDNSGLFSVRTKKSSQK